MKSEVSFLLPLSTFELTSNAINAAKMHFFKKALDRFLAFVYLADTLSCTSLSVKRQM
jgi:hypothetical protein